MEHKDYVYDRQDFIFNALCCGVCMGNVGYFFDIYVEHKEAGP